MSAGRVIATIGCWSIAGGLITRPGPVETPKSVAERVMSIGSVVGGEGPMWSPDGSRILFTSTLAGSGLMSIPADGGMPSRVTGPLASQLVRPSPRGDQVAFVSDQGGNPEIWLWSIKDGLERPLTNLGARVNALSWSPDQQWIAFSALRYGQFDLWKVRIADGQVIRLSDDPRYEIDPSWMPDGRSLLYFRADDRWADHDLMIRSADGGEPRVITTDRDLFDYGTIGTRARVGYPQISPDGKLVLFRSHRSGWIDYWVVPVEGGAPRQLAVEAADQSDARWSPDGRQVAYVSNHNGTMDLRVVAASGGQPRVVVPVTMGVVSSPEWSPDGAKLAYTLATPTRPQDLFVVPSLGGSPRQLTTSIEADIERTSIVPEKVSYRSDEFTINAYLYRPRGLTPGTKAPGILLIHGGPTGQYSDTYSSQAQFLAQMGYAVLAPNIRGSSGYGKAFEDANNPCWTHCDLRDVVAGTEFLKTLPEVDRNKMGITGNSYGGIMTMGAVAHAPLVFQAAAAQSGYANWISFQDYNTELQHTKLLAYEWGPYPDSAAVYRRNSSIFSAEQVMAPVLLIFGTGQTQAWRPGVYPIPAALEFAHALDRSNKVVKVKTYAGESYYVTGRENSKQVLLDLLEWFDQYLRDGVRAPDRAATGGGSR
jgi:dipeptidyl aminopeptidase/acylaminoacyl peptidase